MYYYLERRLDNQITLVSSTHVQIRDETIDSIFSTMLLPTLCTLKGRIDATKKMCKFVSKIPIWIDSQTLWMPIYGRRSTCTLYINYFAIRRIVVVDHQWVTIQFDKETMKKSIPFGIYSRQIQKCQEIEVLLQEKENAYIF
jgi:competence transcription factor ComK